MKKLLISILLVVVTCHVTATPTTPYIINGGTINNTTIGAGTPSTVAATNLSASGTLTLGGNAITYPGSAATLARTDAGQTFTGTQAFGAITASTINGNSFTAGTGTLTIGAGKTLTSSNTLAFTGTDSSTLNIGTGGTLGTGAYVTIANYAALGSTNTFTASQIINAPSLTVNNTSGTNATNVVEYGSGFGYFELQHGGGTHYNWIMAAQDNYNNGFEITPSTVAGGSTFSTASLHIDAATGTTSITAHASLNTGGTAPSISSGACGASTNGSVSGGDQAGIITIGSATTTSCVITFGYTWSPAVRACLFSPGNAAAAVAATTAPYVSNLSNTSFTLSGTVLASTVWYYHCL